MSPDAGLDGGEPLERMPHVGPEADRAMSAPIRELAAGELALRTHRLRLSVRAGRYP